MYRYKSFKHSAYVILLSIFLTGPALAADEYEIGWSGIYTFHSYDNISMVTDTQSLCYVAIYRIADGNPGFREIVNSSLVVTTPSDTCTDDSYEVDTSWRYHLTDTNSNGIIEDTEKQGPFADSSAYKECNFSDNPHEAGDYTINLTLSDGTVISETLTDIPAGLNSTQLPPVTNLAASWDDVNDQLEVSWSLPTSPYPAGASLQLRIFSYKNGHYLNNQMRVQNLPVTLTNFTIDADMTAAFDTEHVDQIKLDVRIKTNNPNTYTRTRQTYSFNSVTGTLTPSPISMKLLDINGDLRTGLEEAIYSLRAASGK